VFHSVFSSG